MMHDDHCCNGNHQGQPHPFAVHDLAAGVQHLAPTREKASPALCGATPTNENYGWYKPGTSVSILADGRAVVECHQCYSQAPWRQDTEPEPDLDDLLFNVQAQLIDRITSSTSSLERAMWARTLRAHGETVSLVFSCDLALEESSTVAPNVSGGDA